MVAFRVVLLRDLVVAVGRRLDCVIAAATLRRHEHFILASQLSELQGSCSNMKSFAKAVLKRAAC